MGRGGTQGKWKTERGPAEEDSKHGEMTDQHKGESDTESRQRHLCWGGGSKFYVWPCSKGNARPKEHFKRLVWQKTGEKQ